MLTSSCKNKGRTLQKEIVDAICTKFPTLQKDVDVFSMPMGGAGMDIRLSAAARKVFPYAIEAKNQEKVNIWAAWKQALRHAGKENLTACAIFRKNRHEPLVVLSLDAFLELHKKTTLHD